MLENFKKHPLMMMSAFLGPFLLVGALTIAALVLIDPYGIH